MKKYAIPILFGACLLAGQQAAAQQTRLLTADKHNEYGIVYTLPITALEIQVTARHSVAKAGPFAQYAKRYLGSDKVVMADSETWAVESVAITPYGVPDMEQSYLMQLKPGALTSLCVAESGMLLAINREVSLPERQKTPGGEEKMQRYTGKEHLQYVTEDFLASQSSAKQAQLLSESLMEVRDAKISLTRGTAETMPTDGRQLELMLASLGDQEAAMSRAFTGWEGSETVTQTFTYIPGEESRSLLFRLSDFDGFVAADDLSGDPVYITVEVTRQGELPKDEKGVEKKMPKDAVAYAIPGAARVSLTMNGRTLASTEVEMAQYGTVFGLNPALFTDKKDPSYAIFNPATGALEKLGSGE